MSKTLSFKIQNCRNGGSASLMGFDLAIGYDTGDRFVGVIEVRGCWLKEKKDKSAYFVSFPSKLRTDKSGDAVVDQNGYKVYDNIVDLYMEVGANKESPDKRAVTEAGWGFRKWIIEEALKAHQQMGSGDAGRGPAKPASKAAPAAAKPKPVAAPTRTQDADDAPGDDDWPF